MSGWIYYYETILRKKSSKDTPKGLLFKVKMISSQKKTYPKAKF